MPGAASSYEVKFTDAAKPTGQIWAGVVGNATPTVTPGQPLTPRGQRNERWFVVWLGTANNPVDKGAATLAQSIRPWSPPAPPPPADPDAAPAPADPNAPPPDPNAPPPDPNAPPPDPNAPPPAPNGHVRLRRIRMRLRRGRVWGSASRLILRRRRGCCLRPDDRARSAGVVILFVSDSDAESLCTGRIPEVGPSAALGSNRQEIARWKSLLRPSCSLGQRH